jgi:hypothetical protein
MAAMVVMSSGRDDFLTGGRGRVRVSRETTKLRLLGVLLGLGDLLEGVGSSLEG